MLWFNKAIDLTESEIRYSFEHCKSLLEMCECLGVARDTFIKYARQHIDEKTGLNYYELAKVKAKENRNKEAEEKKKQVYYKKSSIFDILNGKYPKYNRAKLKDRLIREGIFEEKCMSCGFEERRILDYQVPLLLIFKDGDKYNHVKDNLELVCYNCFFLEYNDLNIKTDNYTKDNMYRIKHV